MNTFRFVDLFAGTGGIRLGFEQACRELNIETECVFSSEIDKKAALSYELNFHENPLNDITQVNEKKLPEFDMLLAGFPCQAFSYAGKQKGFGDTRGTLFFDVERILKEKKPKYFLLENVRGLITHDKGRTFNTIKESLENLGYSVDYLLLNSSNFNVPQNRVRIYILGVHSGDIKLSIDSDLGASDTHKYKTNQSNYDIFSTPVKSKTVSCVLESFEEVDQKYHCSLEFAEQLRSVIGSDLSRLNGYRLIDYRGGNSIHSWELGTKGKCSASEIEFMNLLIANRRKKIFGFHQDGKHLTEEQIKTFYHSDDFSSVTESLINKGYLKCIDGKYNPVAGNMSFEVFKFLDPDGISITLTASDCNRLGIVQNNIPRRLTPRECARLQGYPDSYKLLGDDNAVYKQMGNGVSVPVIKSVMLDFLNNNV
ncbi:DNA cytosine methyltransferase [Vibrio vulnificus]|uniref:DNA cytosine methyltransferase n=1 Tax=Vibrio vulnificus TaxID=672 RepID=UPI0009B6B936|nr:DNA cytosine methyltransferase [Vibrio vulnificus]ELS3716237.1 DNA cytosine methyltransferase [Vibrio fluvialis]EMA3773981.1 DNA cytosine methyltransferase [Vibrio cholerae]ELX9692735.1 DNA cytosine methyltransferase [Vibrio fluvialis]OQK51844.1 Modification methylase BanI [Vibrio vulnificus]HDY7978633.1 DNA cytosine methyltransferase [Vibrio vulnificus]